MKYLKFLLAALMLVFFVFSYAEIKNMDTLPQYTDIKNCCLECGEPLKILIDWNMPAKKYSECKKCGYRKVKTLTAEEIILKL